MSRKFTFQIILSGTIELVETDGAKSIKINPAWRAQAILDGFVRESLAQAATGVEVTGVSASFVDRPASPYEGLMATGERNVNLDAPSTETPDISPPKQ